MTKSKEFWIWFLQKLNYSVLQDWDLGFSFKLGETYIVFVQTEEKYLEPKYHRKKSGLIHIAFHCESEKLLLEIKNL